MKSVFTVGHSTHELERFLELIRDANVEMLVDVRSQPYSRFSPQFNRSTLEATLRTEGIGYRHDENLGGRPDDSDMYDSAGHVLYGRVAESRRFQRAVGVLEEVAGRMSVVIMCGEEDPTDCHRRLLVGRVLGDRGWTVRHIRGDGSVQDEADLVDTVGSQQGLFDEGEFSTWRSARSVSPGSRPPISSDG